MIKGVLIGASLSLLAGCIRVYNPAPPPGPAVVEEAPAPPPPQTEVMTLAPGPVSVWLWVPGCWEWNGRWVWTSGHWGRRPHPGAEWFAAHWEMRGSHRVWVSGHWR